MRFQFDAEQDPETGELGWKDRRVARHSPYGPLAYHFGLAHDCLEHFSLSELSDEIEAHGSIYWVRYLGAWTSKYGHNLTPQGLGADWIGLARAIQDGHELRMPPKTKRLDDEVEEDISTIIASGRKAVKEEGYNDEKNIIAKAFRGWFRIGFRKAARRWARWNLDSASVSHLFNQLAARFEKNMPANEGQSLIVTITKNCEIRFHEPEFTFDY
jgi:hypothetical protein